MSFNSIVDLGMMALITLGCVTLVYHLLRDTVFIIPQQEVAIIERLGRFKRIATAGIGFKIPVVDRIAGRESLRIKEASAGFTARTQDELFVELHSRFQYRVLEDKIFDAFYRFQNADKQIKSFLLNALRSGANELTIDQMFKDRTAIEQHVRQEMEAKLRQFGFEIEAILIDSPEPSKEVRRSFDRVASAKREQDAAKMEGEAVKIKMVAEAEAQAEARRLQGEGIAKQRDAIAKGFADAVATMKSATGGALDEHTVVSVLMMANQYDTIREAANSHGTVVLMPYGGSGAMDDMGRMTAALRALPEKPGLRSAA